jgi:hypothetical protein
MVSSSATKGDDMAHTLHIIAIAEKLCSIIKIYCEVLKKPLQIDAVAVGGAL